MKTYYYIYKITNLVNNKYYVGVHKTSDLNDVYMGSGKVIKDAIKKYGIDNFKKDILEYFEDSESMYAREKEIVTDKFLLREDTYNLRRGGTGGFDFINKNNINNKSQNCNKGGESLAKRLQNDDILLKKYKNHGSNLFKKLHAEGKFRYDNFKGCQHSEETKIKIGESNKVHQLGVNNSQYGTCWIYHELIGNKKIKKDFLPEYIEQGWIKGRIMV
jgi:hypothetical protein